MQIHFDTGNAAELAAVAAMIAHLRGDDGLHNDIAQAIANSNARMGAPEPLRGEPDIRQPTVVPTPPAPPAPPAPPSPGDEQDPAAAFGAPAAPAPSGGATAGDAQPNPGGVELDKNGLPWDGRIHASTKGKIGDGSWRKKVGVTTELTAQVEAELRAALGAPPAAPAPEAPAAPIPPAPPAAPAPVPAPPPAVPVAPVPMAAPVAPVPTPPAADTASGPAAATTAASAPATDFASLMRKITGLQAAGALTVEQTAEISGALGISGVRDLITRPDLVPSFDALLPVAA